jgi:hypothetical protein
MSCEPDKPKEPEVFPNLQAYDFQTYACDGGNEGKQDQSKNEQ